MNQTFQYVGFLSEKSVNGISWILHQISLPENIVVKSTPLIFWIFILLAFWLVTALGKKIQPFIKIALFILILILAIGYFIPNFGLN